MGRAIKCVFQIGQRLRSALQHKIAEEKEVNLFQKQRSSGKWWYYAAAALFIGVTLSHFCSCIRFVSSFLLLFSHFP